MQYNAIYSKHTIKQKNTRTIIKYVYMTRKDNAIQTNDSKYKGSVPSFGGAINEPVFVNLQKSWIFHSLIFVPS
jgi:hypothetical protein